ncbi:MAG TPA: ester cyclase [Gemmatimonadales bacterium]|nr:ester cyclase [Gemmatimonadales bacterium]
MSPQTTISPQALIDAASAPHQAYNDKDWNRMKASLSPGVVYDEIATQRTVRGADQLIDVWKGWAQAFPDSKGTIERSLVSGNTVIQEVTWKGTHRGALALPGGRSIPPSNRPFEVRACIISDVDGDVVSRCRQYFDLATLFRQLGAGDSR